MESVDDLYLSLCRKVLDEGKERKDRTGIGVRSLFGERLNIDLKKGFPLLTTKRVFWRGVVGELLWFLSGSTDTKELSDRGIHIWDGNTSRAALDARGLYAYPEGEVGPSYGWQWRHFGGTYENPYIYGGVDQIADVIAKIKHDPTDRRLIVTAWNPTDLPKMALPPCHVLFQFYVDDGELSCQMYQRSVDIGLGLPFNIASYGLLTHMIAHVTRLKVGRLVLALGDTHIYSNHIDGIREQLTRKPKALPTLFIKGDHHNIDSIHEEDIVLKDYNPHGVLSHPMIMAV